MLGKGKVLWALAGCLPLCIPGYSFSTFENSGGNVHEQITREALAGTISDANLSFIVKSCNSQDAPGSDSLSDPRRHFQDGNFSGALGYIDREKKQALNYAADADADPQNRAQSLRHFGLMLHTVQDFYSRTNYLELQLENASKRQDPYSIEVVDWAKVPDGYLGKTSGAALTSVACKASSATTTSDQGTKSKEPAGSKGQADLSKDNGSTAEGKKAVGSSTYFKVARDLAVRETQRQWNLFETLIRGRFHARADAIIAALKQASPDAKASPDSLPDLD